MSPRSLAKQLNIGNTASLERRIKRELEEQGKQDRVEKCDHEKHKLLTITYNNSNMVHGGT